MKNEFECPCCGNKTLKERNNDDVCYFCGLQDTPTILNERYYNGQTYLQEKKKFLLKNNKNVDGGTLPWSTWKGLEKAGFNDNIPSFLKVGFNDNISDIYNKLILIKELANKVSIKQGTIETGWTNSTDYIEVTYHELCSWFVYFDGESDGNYYSSVISIQSEDKNLTHYHPDKKDIIIDIYIAFFDDKIYLRKDKPTLFKGKYVSYKYKILSKEYFEKRKNKLMMKSYKIFSNKEIYKK